MSFTKDQINAVNLRSGRFDMTRIPRLRTDFTAEDNVLNPSALNALNERVNEHSERCEDLWIELDLQLLDAIEAEKERKRNRTVNTLKRQCIDLFREGYMASEIHSITRASLQDIAKWTKKVTFDDAMFEDCPEDIKNDLLSDFE
tara:strand:+ start:219 stop:653 length:435 start_codon:yes stop_codon:yes gene_type:complete